MLERLDCDSRPTLEWRGWPLLWCVVGLLAAGYPTILSGFANVQGGLGDPLLVNFTLEYSFRWVAEMPLADDLWSPPIFYPVRDVATYTDLLLGVAPIYWSWRWLGFTPHTAYQLWMLSCWALNFLTYYLLLNRGIRVTGFAAGAGAALFAFGSPRFANIMHQQLVPQFFLVVSLWAAVELTRSSNRSSRRGMDWLWTALLIAGITLQFLTAVYPLIFSLIAAAAALAIGCLSRSCRRTLLRVLGRIAIPLTVLTTLAAVVAAPVLLKYLQTSVIVGPRQYSVTRLPNMSSWFLMGKFNVLYGWLHDWLTFPRSDWPLHHNGLGFFTPILCAIGLWKGRGNRLVQFLVIGLAALFICTLRWPWNHSLWPLIREVVPGAAALRAVARVGMMALFPAAVGLAFFMDRVAARRAWLLALFSFLVMAEQIHFPLVFDKGAFETQVENISSRIPNDSEAFLLTTTVEKSTANPHDVAPWVSFVTNVPTINGRYGNRPREWRLRHVEATTQEQTEAIRLSLQQWITDHSLDPDRITCLPMDPDPVFLEH